MVAGFWKGLLNRAPSSMAVRWGKKGHKVEQVERQGEKGCWGQEDELVLSDAHLLQHDSLGRPPRLDSSHHDRSR